VCRVLEKDGSEREIPVVELQRGWRFVVNPGETIPADGVIAVGEGFVREAEMTGEGFVVNRRPGDTVWAGTHGVDARFEIVAAANGAERRIDRILDAIERARPVPSTLQRAADRVVGWFLPVVATLAAATFAGWTWHSGWQEGLFNAMAVLLVACPCALGLATPLAVWGALARLAGRGLVARGGDAVEALAAVDTALFDKTGTLTEPRTVLVDLVVGSLRGLSEETVRAVLAAVQRASTHPVAAAFHDLASGCSDEMRVVALRLLPGRGVEAEVADAAGASRRVAVGTAALLTAADDPAWQRLRRRLREVAGARELVVLIDDEVVAAAVVDERLRSSWRDALGELHELGVATAVLTGDTAERAMRTGASRVLASLRPEDKVAEVERLHAAGRRILFVGDGVNDAAAMAASEVSVAVTSGAELAAEVADISWHSGDLRVLPWAIGLARGTVSTIRTNLRFALLYNVAGIALAVAGLLHPVAAAILMTCSSLVVTWRATTPFAEEEAEAAAEARLRASMKTVGAAT
jgi:heavy metal translocating P-type ATPase